jgi:hypothetical protein
VQSARPASIRRCVNPQALRRPSYDNRCEPRCRITNSWWNMLAGNVFHSSRGDGDAVRAQCRAAGRRFGCARTVPTSVASKALERESDEPDFVAIRRHGVRKSARRSLLGEGSLVGPGNAGAVLDETERAIPACDLTAVGGCPTRRYPTCWPWLAVVRLSAALSEKLSEF